MVDKNNTYASFLEYVSKYGIKAKTHIPITDDVGISNNATNDKQNSEQNGLCGDEDGLYGRGLFHYRKWWERSKVDIFVNGDMLTGIPIFTDKNTLRVVNDDYSYFIPLEKVDYIRTIDGLNTFLIRKHLNKSKKGCS